MCIFYTPVFVALLLYHLMTSVEGRLAAEVVDNLTLPLAEEAGMCYWFMASAGTFSF